MIRRHSASATEPSDFVGSPQSTTRVTPSGWSSVGVVTTAAMMPAVFCPRGRSTGTSVARVVEVVLDQGATRAGEHRRQLVRVDQPATTGPEDLGGVVVERLEHLGRRLPRPRSPRPLRAGRRTARTPAPASPSGPRTRPWASTSSMPAPSVSGRIFLPSAARPSLSISTTGHTWTHTWFMSSLLPAAPRATRVRRIASRQFSTARSACGRPLTLPSSSRTTASWRTWARATSRRSAGFSRATHS